MREAEEEMEMMRSQRDGGDEYEQRHWRRGGTEAAAVAVSEAPAFYPVCALLPPHAPPTRHLHSPTQIDRRIGGIAVTYPKYMGFHGISAVCC